MTRQFKNILPTCLGLATSLVTFPAFAKHPVKEVPVVVYQLEDASGYHRTATNETIMQRNVEFANRAWANAGLRFIFNPDQVGTWNVMTDPDLNCYGDDIQDDADTANWLADVHDDAVVIVARAFGARPNTPADCRASCAGGTPCGYGSCITNSWDISPYCGPTAHFAVGPYCYDYNGKLGTQCVEMVPCLEVWPDTTAPFLRAMVFVADGLIRSFAHEVGHHFSLVHTFAHSTPGTHHCVPDIPLDHNCGTGEDPCEGQLANYSGCTGSTPPWKNIMSYHTYCQSRYAGDGYGSLTPGQIGHVWKAIHEYWDKPVTQDPPQSPQMLGGYETMLVANSSSSLATDIARGGDSYGTVVYSDTGSASWTKGNVRAVLGHLNGDSFLDAVITDSSGTHVYLGGWSFFPPKPILTYLQTLDAAAVLTNSSVAVGNVTKGECDDVLVTTSSGTRVWEGTESGALVLQSGYVLPGSWPSKVIVGDVHGSWPGTPGIRASESSSTTNLAYDDVVVLSSTGASVYAGGPGAVSTTPADSSTSFTSSTATVWRANVLGDRHDELIVRTSTGLKVIQGADTFDFDANPLWTSGTYTSSDVRLTIGNFGNDEHADFVVTAPSPNGSRLWVGGMTSISAGDWWRTDLLPSNCDMDVADFIRRGYDDLMIVTSSASWLYAGVQSGSISTFTPNVWYDTSRTRSTAEWFGRE